MAADIPWATAGAAMIAARRGDRSTAQTHLDRAKREVASLDDPHDADPIHHDLLAPIEQALAPKSPLS